VTATINGIAVAYVLNSDDTNSTAAAMLALYINANKRLNKYIKATWDSGSPTVVTITCLHGALTVPALLKAHNAGIADPTTAPTCAAIAGVHLRLALPWLMLIRFLWPTALTAQATVVVFRGGKIDVSSCPLSRHRS
jgi:hypothetical protein